MGHQRTRDDRSGTDRGSRGRSDPLGVDDRARDDDVARSLDARTAESSGTASLEDRWQGDPQRDAGDATATADDDPSSVVRVDRGKLTDRQLEVIRTAHEMGYYQYPRGANASEVADALDICPSTLAEHLAAAQTKLLADVLGDVDA